jgi:GT2 family glycosyltransferase
MISIVFSTHKDLVYNEKFKQHLLQSVGLDDVQILEYQNNNQYSLAEVYNSGITESIYNIIVCCHNDIKLENGWGVKLLKDFENNPEYGIIGKAGSCYFPESGIYWERMQQTMVGQVYHHPEGQKKWLSKYSPKLPFIIPVVTIDGLFISFDKTKIKHTFDETIGKFHFYDHGFCIPNYLEDVKIGVTSSFDITHQSVGQPNQEFFESKNEFLEKWGNRLPLDLKPDKIFVPDIIEKPLKNIGKVAVIIPTKGKVDILYDCVKSFYEHCNPNLFTIFIADTGSNNEEKLWIKENILNLGDIKFIEYDYYNFAKINNDVVKNHIDDSYEFLLFCNNDIKILNNIIYGMLNIFKNNKNAGTVGCRLHYKNNTVQHDSFILALHQKNKNFIVTHKNRGNYYNYNIGINETIGNTAALSMIRKNVFIKNNMFNESYSECFVDVVLNILIKSKGFINYTDSGLVSYHLESETRGVNQNKINLDYIDNLHNFLIKIFDKIKKDIFYV